MLGILWVAQCPCFVGCSDKIMKWACFISLYHGNLVCSWCPVRLFMSKRRITWHNCECQVSFQMSGAAFISLFSLFLHIAVMGVYNFVPFYNMCRFVWPSSLSRCKTILSPQRSLLCCPFLVTPTYLPLTIPKTHRFSSSVTLPLWECLINGIIHHVTFWYWLLSPPHNALEIHPRCCVYQ